MKRPILLSCALMLTVLLPQVGAAKLLRSAVIPGHGAGSFGFPGEPFGSLTGGVAWAADGRQVVTLDTTGQLSRWDAQTGKWLAGRTQKVPLKLSDAAFPPALTLDGWTGGRLRVRASGWRGERQVSQDYAVDPVSGAARPVNDCPASRANRMVCLPGGSRAFVTGGQLVREVGGKRESRPLPAGVQVDALALSKAGRVAALGFRAVPGRDVVGGQRATLLDWPAGRSAPLRTVSLGDRDVVADGAQLTWAGDRLAYALSVYDPQHGGALTGQEVGVLTSAGQRVWSISPDVRLRGAWPSPDGRQIVTIRDGSVPEIRRLADGAFVRGLGEAVTAAVPLGGSRAILAVNSGGGRGRLLLSSPAGLVALGAVQAQDLAVNLDGSRLLSVSGSEIRLHDRTGRVLMQVKTDGFVSEVAFTPDGKQFSAFLYRGEQGEGVTQAWTLDGQPVKLPARTVFPLTSPAITLSGDQKGPDQTHREQLTAVTLAGQRLWQSAWRVSYRLTPSANGRWLAAWSQSPEATRDPGPVDFFRLDLRTGRPSATLTLKPTTADPNSMWNVAALSQDGRMTLLSENSGDGCGWGLLGMKLVDLGSARALPTPAALAKGYNRFGGCGRGTPFLETKFGPGGELLIRDGNRLDFWQAL